MLNTERQLIQQLDDKLPRDSLVFQSLQKHPATLKPTVPATIIPSAPQDKATPRIIEGLSRSPEYKKVKEQQVLPKPKPQKLYYYQRFLQHNELGKDIFRTEQQDFEDKINKFIDKEDWAIDIEEVRRKNLINPNVIPGQEGELQPITKETIVSENGHLLTKEDILKIKQHREKHYFDLFGLAMKVNVGLNGNLMEHSGPERLAKLGSIEQNHNEKRGGFNFAHKYFGHQGQK